MTRARWALLAQADFAEIEERYREVAPDFAEALGRAFLAASRIYAIVYRPVLEGVEILRIYHVRQDWRRAL